MSTPKPQGVSRKAWTKLQGQLQDIVFVHVEEVVKLMADDPRRTVHSVVIRARAKQLREDAKRLAQTLEAAGTPQAGQVVEQARKVTRRIITALTADALKSVWGELAPLLRSIMEAERTGEGPE